MKEKIKMSEENNRKIIIDNISYFNELIVKARERQRSGQMRR